MDDQAPAESPDGNESKERAKRSVPPVVSAVLIIALFFGVVSGMFALAGVAVARQTVQKGHGRYLTLAREAGVKCPAIADRIPEFAGDGYVTLDELEIVKTLLDLERAKPGGMNACAMRLSWH